MAMTLAPSRIYAMTGSRTSTLGFFKSFKFGPDGRIDAQLRGELFNAFNRVQFDPPNTSCCGGASFGQVTGQYNIPRNIQFALRVSF